jgi:DMSO/TMAO reductase YedYZ molybdopterin-dependent catalytic subunit
MNVRISLMSNPRSFSRRAFLAGAGQLGAIYALNPRFSSRVLAQDIKPDPRMIVRSTRPQDWETPVALLNSWITPNNLFFVRHHMYPADVKAEEWRLSVDGLVERPLTLQLSEVRSLPKTSVTVTLECAGNGRAFFDPPVAGVQWERGAVGTARWTGVRLAELLKKAGVKTGGKYVILDGADKPMAKMPDFIRNVPLEKAMHADTILAYEMNGEPLPMLHGFPLRAIVPGWEGAYAVKWLTHIQLSDKEHEGFFVQTAYRYPSKRIAPGAAVDPKDMLPLSGLLVKSLINSPLEGATVKAGSIRITGFAWAGEDNVSKVDVSLDNGTSWQPARLGKERERYTWLQFEHEARITEPGSYLILSRATDDQGRQQPVAPMWNPSGYLWNAIDRVRINVEA